MHTKTQLNKQTQVVNSAYELCVQSNAFVLTTTNDARGTVQRTHSAYSYVCMYLCNRS